MFACPVVVVQDSERCKELLPELVSLSALAQERLDALWQIVQRAPAGGNGVRPSPEVAKHLQALPGWARAAFHESAPDSLDQQLGSLRTLSVVVSGFVELGLDVTVRDKEMQNPATVAIVNICWKTVHALLSHKAICEAAGRAQPANNSSPEGAIDDPEQDTGGSLLLSTGAELEDILDILLRATALAFCSAASASSKDLTDDKAESIGSGQPQALPSKGLATFRNRVLVARFLQNNAVRLAVLYPEALLARTTALLVSFTAVLSSSLDLDAGFLSEEEVNVVASAFGGNLHGLLMHLLATNSSRQMLHHLCSFQQLPARAPSASHKSTERAASYEGSLRQLETMASFQVSDTDEDECASVPVPSAPEGQLWVLAAVLDGSRNYPPTVLEAIVAALPSVITAMEEPRVSGALTALFSIPSILAQGKDSGQGQGKPAPEPATLFQRLSGGLRSLSATVMAAASSPPGNSKSSGQEEMRLWMALQRFLFQVATHPHPVLADMVLDSWELIAAHSHSSLPEHHINLLFTLLRKASALSTVLEAGKAADAGKGSGQGRSFSDVRKGATERAVSTAAGLTLLRLSRLTTVVLAVCQPSSLRKLVPPFLRQAAATIKQGTAHIEASVSEARMLLQLLQAGYADVLFRRSRDDFTSLLSSLVQVASQLLDSKEPHAQASEEGFAGTATLLGLVLDCISELASRYVLPAAGRFAYILLLAAVLAALAFTCLLTRTSFFVR